MFLRDLYSMGVLKKITQLAFSPRVHFMATDCTAINKPSAPGPFQILYSSLNKHQHTGVLK